MSTDKISFFEDGNRYVASTIIEESGHTYTIAACNTLSSDNEVKMQYVIYDGENQIEEYSKIAPTAKFFEELTALQEALSARILSER